MKAYRVNLIGSHNSYLITERQKQRIQPAVEKRTSRYVQIGGDMIQTASVSSIVTTNVDLDSCPDYFQAAVEEERKGQPEVPTYRSLPTQWLILSRKGELLSDNIGRLTLARLTQTYPNQAVLLARCHYVIGADNQRQYYTALEQIPEAKVVALDPEYAINPSIGKMFFYGQERTVKEVMKGK